MKPLSECRLYTFLDTAYLHGRPPEMIVQRLCDGGSDLIQLRAKKSSPGEILQLAELIAPITRRAGVGLVINDHPRIAAAISAEYCHLGQEEFFGSGHTAAGPFKIQHKIYRLGLSTHLPNQAKAAVAAGADYIGVGPVYATGTKPGVLPVTVDYVRWAAKNVKIPWFAIGGITLENLDNVLAAGARRICVVSAILEAPDIADACRQFKSRIDAAALASA